MDQYLGLEETVSVLLFLLGSLVLVSSCPEGCIFLKIYDRDVVDENIRKRIIRFSPLKQQ